MSDSIDVSRANCPSPASTSSSANPIPRGLAHAALVRKQAREHFKSELNLRSSKISKNCASLSAKQKYHRRLAKNQASAAAARHAHDAYISNLELQVRAYDIEMTNMEFQESLVKRQLNENLRQNEVLNERNRMLLQQITEIQAVLSEVSQNSQGISHELVEMAIEDTPIEQLFEPSHSVLNFANAIDADISVVPLKSSDYFDTKTLSENLPMPELDFRVPIDDCLPLAS